MPTSAVVLALAAMLCVSGCSNPNHSSPIAPAPERPGAALAGAPVGVDFQAVVERVHFAFRGEPSTGAFVGGHATYASRVEASGAWTMRAVLPDTRRAAPAALRLSTIAMRVGRRSLSGSLALEARDGAVSLTRGPGVVETLRNTASGVEQTWRFEARPGRVGEPLRIEVSASGAPWLRSTAEGHHFGVEGEPLVRYGHATWVDALGTSTPVPVSWDSGRLVMTVPAALLDRSPFPAVLDPLLTPESGLDQPVLGTAFGIQSEPDVAYSANQFLLVWTSVDSINGTGSPRLMGARIGPTGALLDAIGFLIDAPLDGVVAPKVASDGTDYLVVYSVGPPVGKLAAAWSAKVTAAGVVSAPQPIEPANTDAQWITDVGFGGGVYLVAWEGTNAGVDPDARLARLNATGVLQGTSFTVGGVAGWQTRPEVAFDGTGGFLVTWVDGSSGTNRILGAQVTPAGAVLNAPGSELRITDGGAPDCSSVAFNGATFDVAVLDQAGGGASIVPVTPGGGVAAPVTTLPGFSGCDARLLGGNGAALFIHTDGVTGALSGQRFSSAGAVMDPTPFTITSGVNRKAVFGAGAWDEGRARWLVVWRSEISNAAVLQDDTSIRGALVAGAPVAVTGVGVLSKSFNAQSFTAVAYASQLDTWLVAWTDFRGDLTTVRGARVARDGTVKDPAGIELLSHVSLAYLTPSVASDGRNFAVTGSTVDPSPIEFVRVNGSTGAVLDNPPRVISLPATVPAAFWPSVTAMTGGDYLVTWYDETRGLPCNGWIVRCGDVMAARVRATDGQVSWRTNLQQWGLSFIQGPSAAWDGQDNVLVAWTDGDTGAARATRLDSSGTVLNLPPLTLSPLTSRWSTVGFGNGEFLVAFDGDDAGTNLLRMRRVALDGTLPDAEASAVTHDTEALYLARLAWDGADWVMTWHQGAGVLQLDVPTASMLQRFRARTLAPVGPRLVLGSLSGNIAIPSLASDGKGTTAVVYAADDAVAKQSRTKLRFLKSMPDGAACQQDGECHSSFCRSGVCCDADCAGVCQSCLKAMGAPADGTCGFKPSSTLCRADAGVCDPAETCDGTTANCPADVVIADGVACGSADACTAAGSCRAGACEGVAPVTCAAASECREGGSCNAQTGCVEGTPKANGVECSTGACQDGVCVAPVARGPSSYFSYLSCAAADAGAWPLGLLALLAVRRRRARAMGGAR